MRGASDLPDPAVRHDAAPPVDARALAAALAERVGGEVRSDAGSRAAHSTDASNFRQTPIGAVVPRTPEAAVEAVAVAREHGAPVLSRGGGAIRGRRCTGGCGRCGTPTATRSAGVSRTSRAGSPRRCGPAANRGTPPPCC
ncbi:hypothetical protein SUDANB176_05647 [Streptomyces sp. enrichment culture]